jgi:hypothetical protein
MVAAAVQWAEPILRKIDNGKPEESSLRPLRHGATNMTVDDFRQSLTAAKPPTELTLALVGLWWDAKGDWKRAHESAQHDEGPKGSWVHATSIARKAIRATQPTGTVGRGSLFANNHSMRNGSAS